MSVFFLSLLAITAVYGFFSLGPLGASSAWLTSWFSSSASSGCPGVSYSSSSSITFSASATSGSNYFSSSFSFSSIIISWSSFYFSYSAALSSCLLRSSFSLITCNRSRSFLAYSAATASYSFLILLCFRIRSYLALRFLWASSSCLLIAFCFDFEAVFVTDPLAGLDVVLDVCWCFIMVKG